MSATPDKVYFILTVDTEEEWDWREAFPEENYGLQNIEQLIPFQALCEADGIKPTYFVDYAVLNCDASAGIIRQLLATGNAEVGAHLHPWNNPPYYGETGERESHLVNLPEEQVRSKLVELVNIIQQKLNIQSTSFRTGRWGIDGKVLRLLHEFGFTVDSSVIPYYETDYFTCYGCPGEPYYPDWNDPLKTAGQREILEIPVTSGFNRRNYEFSSVLHRWFSQSCLKHLRLVGLAWQLKLLRKMFLSPELTQLEDMKSLCETALGNGHQVIHLFIHSSSLIDNPNSQVGNTNAYQTLTESIQALVAWLQERADVEFCTISEYAEIHQLKERQS